MSRRSPALTNTRAKAVREAYARRPADEKITDTWYRLAREFRISPSTARNVVLGLSCYGLTNV